MIDINAVRTKLPLELSQQLQQVDPARTEPKFGKGELADTITTLLHEHDELSIDEILVGIYLETRQICQRKTLMVTLSVMVRAKKIARLDRGKYGCRKVGSSRYPIGFRDPFGPPPATAISNSIG